MEILNFHSPVKKVLFLWMGGSVVNLKSTPWKDFFCKVYRPRKWYPFQIDTNYLLTESEVLTEKSQTETLRSDKAEVWDCPIRPNDLC